MYSSSTHSENLGHQDSTFNYRSMTVQMCFEAIS